MAEKMKKDAAELPGTSREAEEQQHMSSTLRRNIWCRRVKPSGRQMKILLI